MSLDIFYWKSTNFDDNRGSFTKIFTPEVFTKIRDFDLQDYFLTNSNQSVIRGMHLQTGGFASNRIIFVNQGEIEDVLVDLRGEQDRKIQPKKNVKRLGPKEEFDCVFVPSRVAHGFAAVKDSEIIYISDKTHSLEHDNGFHPLSFFHTWAVKNPVISERDKKLPFYENFKI